MAKVDVKVVLLGMHSVGKTCLLDRCIDNAFDEACRNTVGAGFAAKKVSTGSGQDVSLGIWDTAGAERFESLSRLYYNGAEAALVCVDCCSPASFQKARFWVSELNSQQGSPCRIYLVITKCDLLGPAAMAQLLQELGSEHSGAAAASGVPSAAVSIASSSVPDAPSTTNGGRPGMQQVSASDVAAYASALGARVFATSAKSGLGVEELFHRVAEDCLDSILLRREQEAAEAGANGSARGGRMWPAWGGSPPPSQRPASGSWGFASRVDNGVQLGDGNVVEAMGQRRCCT